MVYELFTVHYYCILIPCMMYYIKTENPKSSFFLLFFLLVPLLPAFPSSFSSYFFTYSPSLSTHLIRSKRSYRLRTRRPEEIGENGKKGIVAVIGLSPPPHFGATRHLPLDPRHRPSQPTLLRLLLSDSNPWKLAVTSPGVLLLIWSPSPHDPEPYWFFGLTMMAITAAWKIADATSIIISPSTNLPSIESSITSGIVKRLLALIIHLVQPGHIL